MCKTHLSTADMYNVVRHVRQCTLKYILKDCKALQCPVLIESAFLTKPPHFSHKKEHKRTVNPLAGILCCYTVPLVLCGGLLLYFVHLLKSDLYIIFPGSTQEEAGNLRAVPGISVNVICHLGYQWLRSLCRS